LGELFVWKTAVLVGCEKEFEMQTLLEQAVSYIKAGNTEGGKQLLIEVLKQNPKDENAWLWMSKCVTSISQKKDCFQKVLQINPNNQYAVEGLRRLDNVQNKKPVGSVNPAPKKKTFLTTNSMLIIGIFACVCIVFSILGGVALNLPSTSKPTPTNAPVVLDVISLMGKSLDEIRSLYTVIDTLYELPLNEPDRDYANIDYGEEYTDGKYDFTIFYDENYIVNQVDLTVPYYYSPDLSQYEPSYKLSEWRAVMQMLNLNITYPPDETAPIAYVWKNYNGYRVRINSVINKDIILYAKVIKLK
jgi:hypothetical protein